jgi:hypothetical protein
VSHYLDIKNNDKQNERGVLTTTISRIGNYILTPAPEEDFDTEFEEITRVMLKINSEELQRQYELSHRIQINGLQKYSCEVCIYTPNNIFFIQPPQYSREAEYYYWDLGYFDPRNMLFYELGLLTKGVYNDKNLFFADWILFLQILIDKKIYTKLFESLSFNKGMLFSNDRLLYEPAFIRSIKHVSEEILSVDFLIYLCDLMKNNNQMVSFSILKKKVASNLKNFQL